ncbi:hypothetical protein Taro_013349 [Colocasia esculenta]|uniref:Uncharacterized protein n=1 Tax=Colocasia esculenta TaxID=4460 RepID=A0A843UBL3_COLES|nr:hypothetical protein [Colocasia esculenta]
MAIVTWSLSRQADRSHLGGRRFNTKAVPHFPLSPFLFSFFLLLPLLSSLVILQRFLVLVLRWCHPVRAGDVLVVLGARRGWPFRGEGPNGSALLFESMLPSPCGMFVSCFGVVSRRTALEPPPPAENMTAIEVAMMSRLAILPRHHCDTLERRNLVTTAWATATVRLLNRQGARRAEETGW